MRLESEPLFCMLDTKIILRGAEDHTSDRGGGSLQIRFCVLDYPMMPMNPLRFYLLAFSLIFMLSGRAEEPTFAGEWETTYGLMKLKVEGTKVSGAYQSDGDDAHDIKGTVKDLVWQFTYQEPGVTGEGSFTLSADGQSFAGRWREKGAGTWQTWAGRRPSAGEGSFSGVWKTTYGQMRLIQRGTAVIGCYQYQGQSDISGTIREGVLQFTYTESTGTRGSGSFKLGGGAASFAGPWKTGDGKQGGQWEGTRIEPRAGRSWLVVLEAHWESNLQQPEYSYGEMLRQFFTRVPHVAVRHRYFDSKDDFATWCGELAYLNEPAVLYVSSHGTGEGITVGKHVLTGEFIGRQLRYAPEVKLVHLGSCLTMAGEAPVALRKASGYDLPISGFTRVADWAGSAVIDFAYLDLILSRGMAPGEAVRQICKSVSFAGEEDSPDSVIKPAGLKIIE